MPETTYVGRGSAAHRLLTEKAKTAGKCLQSLLKNESRDFELIEWFLLEYRLYSTAADKLARGDQFT